ncbi:MAG: hypothetical protein L3K04_01585 [Thermoplasmata archaeon]|nr:hypothetical protein [Thermoplasmata archaeon]MCI4338108.1 hypothetical protein [Thermoplasmata archaeon]MCI4341775.1 hypothetical protein [Thermoplasmata archaeon]
MGESGFQTPYARSPGGSLPDPSTPPAEGRRELWSFFWLSLLNTAIIGTAGVAVWLLIHH